MRISNAIHFINTFGEVHFHGFNWLLFARKVAAKPTPYEATWNSEFRNKCAYPLDIHKETSYAECINGKFQVKENKLFMCLKIWEGDNFTGVPIGLRCTFTLPITSISPEIARLITNTAKYEANRICIREDEEAYNVRVQNIVKLLLCSES